MPRCTVSDPWTSRPPIPPTPTVRPTVGAGWPPSGRGGKASSTRSAGPAASRTRTASTAPTALAEVRADWPDLAPGTETEAEVAVAGRVVLQRDAGKLVFATIAERGAELQLFISKAAVGDETFADVKDARPRGLGRRPRSGDDDAHRRAVGEGRPARAARQVDQAAARQVARPATTPTPGSASATSTSSSTPTPGGRSTCATRYSPASAARCASAATSRSRRRSSTSTPAVPTPARSSPITTRSTWRCTCGSPPSCTSSG